MTVNRNKAYPQDLTFSFNGQEVSDSLDESNSDEICAESDAPAVNPPLNLVGVDDILTKNRALSMQTMSCQTSQHQGRS